MAFSVRKRYRGSALCLLLAFTVQCAWSVCNAESIWLDELDLSKIRQGWGQAQKNLSLDARALTIEGKTYERGIDTHATSIFTLDLHGSAKEFTAVAGLDDEAEHEEASVRFKAYGDGKVLWQSPVVKAGSSTQVLVDLKDINTLVLVVNDGGDGIASDHADWALAKIEFEGQAPQSADPPDFNWYPPYESATNQLEIVIVEDNWAAPKADIQNLLDNVRDNFFSAFQDKPMGLVNVYKRNSGPMIIYRKIPDESFTVHLNTGKTYWCQYSYQFSHELCHLAMKYDNHRGNPHPFKWFHECICEAASIYTIRLMSKTWLSDPPYSNWKSFSKSLAEYAEDRLKNPAVALPKDITLGRWHETNRNILRYNHAIRPLNSIVAHKLLVFFEKNPAGWNAICYMPDASGTFREYLVTWHQASPSKYRRIIRDIAREFGYSI